MFFQVWIWPVPCRSVLSIEMSWISVQQRISVGLTLTPCKMTAFKIYYWANLTFSFVKRWGIATEPSFFSLEAFMCWIPLLVASSWVWKLSLLLVFRLDFKWGKELKKRHFVCKKLNCLMTLPSKVTSLLKLTACLGMSPSPRDLQVWEHRVSLAWRWHLSEWRREWYHPFCKCLIKQIQPCLCSRKNA